MSVTATTSPAITDTAVAGGAVFDTPVGQMGITWSDRGIRTAHLPEPDVATLKRLLRHDCGSRPLPLDDAPGEVRDAAERVAAMLGGADDDLSSIRLDTSQLTEFADAIYAALRTVGPGDTITYGDLARRAGYHSPGVARAVGNTLGNNPFSVIIPCHRVVAANQRIGGFSAHGGLATKVRLLLAEARGEAASSELPYDVDLARKELAIADDAMAALIDTVGDAVPRLRPMRSTVAALTRAIVYQQLHGRAAAAIHARLCALFPRPLEGPTDSGIVELGAAGLREAGLSASKAAALLDLAERSIAGEIPGPDELWEMDNDAIIDALTRVRGVGRWTVEMLLIFQLGRPDVLPVDDLGVQKGLARIDGLDKLPTPRELAKRGEVWQPWRSVAGWYLWRAADLVELP